MLARHTSPALLVAVWLLLATYALACPCFAEAQQQAAAVPSVVVEVHLPGASPLEVESQIIAPLERQLGLVQGAAEMTSVASEGVGCIRLTLKAGTKIEDLLTAVANGVRQVQLTLPEDSAIELRIDSGEQAAWLLLTPSETASAAEVWEEAKRIAARIERMTHVQYVQLPGNDAPPTRIRIDLDKLQRHMAVSTLTERVEALAPQRGMDPLEYWSDALISAEEGMPLRLRDVAEISQPIPLMTGGRSDPSSTGFLMAVFPVMGRSQEVQKQLDTLVNESTADQSPVGTLTLIDQGLQQLCLTIDISPLLSAETEREKILHIIRHLHSNPSVESVAWNLQSDAQRAFLQVKMKEAFGPADLAGFQQWLDDQAITAAVQLGAFPDVRWPWTARETLVWVSGPEQSEALKIAARLAEEIASEPQLAAVQIATPAIRHSLQVNVSDDARHQLGVSLRSIAKVCELALTGRVINSQDPLDRQAVLSIGDGRTSPAEMLGRLDIETQSGQRVALSQVTTVTAHVNKDILHRNGQRATYITATLINDNKPAVRERLRRLAEKFTRDNVMIDVEVR